MAAKHVGINERKRKGIEKSKALQLLPLKTTM